MHMQDPWMGKSQPRLQRTLIHIGGMVNTRCASSVASALGLVPGVSKVAVSLEEGRATVSYDPRKAEPQQFCVAVHAVGFRPQIVEEPLVV